MRKFKAIALDFDGVVLESAEIKTQAFSGVFKNYPKHLEAIINHHLNNVGVSRYEKFKFVYKSILKVELTEKEMKRLGECFTELSLEKVKACVEVPGALEFLKEVYGRYSLFIVSGTPQKELEEVIEFRGLSGYFTKIFGSPPAKNKIFSEILNHWSLKAHEVLFVGDSMTDYKEAHLIGVPFIGRKGPEGETFDSINVPTISDLSELRSLVDSNDKRYFGENDGNRE